MSAREADDESFAYAREQGRGAYPLRMQAASATRARIELETISLMLKLCQPITAARPVSERRLRHIAVLSDNREASLGMLEQAMAGLSVYVWCRNQNSSRRRDFICRRRVR